MKLQNKNIPYTRSQDFVPKDSVLKNSFAEYSFTGDSGLSRLHVLLLTLVAGVLVFIGWNILPFYYYFHELEGLMEAQAKKATVFTDDEIEDVLMKRIKEMGIPMDEENELKINRFEGKIFIELEYSELFYIDLGGDRVYDIWEFHFHPKAEAPIE